METRTAKIGNLTVIGYSTDYVFQTVEKTGDFYEAQLLRKWTPLLDSPKYILDIGANLGNHTLFWGTQLDSAQIIAVEPFEDNYKLLCENIEKNNLGNVIPLKVALGEKDGIVAVKQFNPENYGGTAFEYLEDGTSEDYAAEVRTADDVVVEFQIPQVDFAKIDTEGFELSVLKGMQYIIDQSRPALWVEVCKETAADVYTLLRSKGYNLVEMVAANTLFIPTEKAQGKNISLEFLLSENMTLLSKVNTYYSNYETSKKWLANKDAKLKEWETKFSHLQKESIDLQEKQKQQLQQLQEIKDAEMQALQKATDRAVQVAVQQVLQESEKAVRQAEQDCQERTQQIEANYTGKLRQVEQEYEKKIQKVERNHSAALTQAKQDCEERVQQIEAGYTGKLRQVEQEKRRLENELAVAEEECTLLSAQLERVAQEIEEDEQLLATVRKQLLQMNSQLQGARQRNTVYEEKLNKVYGTWYGRLALKCYKALRKFKHLLLRK